jgi:hypothetical protein
MIQLHPDCLIFRTSQGELIPCSAESVTIEMIGDASSIIDPETVREAAAAVVHYFKYDLHRDTVSVAEFSDALQRALRCFGFDVTTSTIENAPSSTDLRDLARAAGDFELGFFQALREEFVRQAKESQKDPVRFSGLRGCTKQMTRAKRWGLTCERFSQQVVDFLRNCLSMEPSAHSRGLIVR